MVISSFIKSDVVFVFKLIILISNSLAASLASTNWFSSIITALTFKSQGYRIKIFDYTSFNKNGFLNFIPHSKSFVFLNNYLYEYFGIIKYIFLGYIKINI